MSKIFTIAKKELSQYFKSPSAYIILIISCAVFNVFFYMIINENREATLRDVFQLMEFMFIFIVPLLTMRVFSEEKMNGTLEFLLTTPTRAWFIVLGKYLGALLFYFVMISVSLIYYLILHRFGAPDIAEFISGIIGIMLEGALFISIGLLASSLTRHQIIAAIITYVILFFLYFCLSFTHYTAGTLESVFRYLSTLSHLENFSQGLIRLSDFVYYFTGIFTCLGLAHYSLRRE